MTDCLALNVLDKVSSLLWQFQDVIALDGSDLSRTQLLYWGCTISPLASTEITFSPAGGSAWDIIVYWLRADTTSGGCLMETHIPVGTEMVSYIAACLCCIVVGKTYQGVV